MHNLKRRDKSCALVIIALAQLFMILESANYIEARSFPPTASRSFRFPNSQEEELWNSIKNSNIIQAKNAHSTDDNSAPIDLGNRNLRDKIQKSNEEDENSGEAVSVGISAESVSGEGIESGTNENEGNRADNTPPEDEELRNALCPPMNSSFITDKNEDYKNGLSSKEENIKVRYDLHAGKCAHVHMREHCGENMIFVAEIDSAAYGYCECDFENKIARREGKAKEVDIGTPLVFHQESNSCFKLYEQAYCKDGQWLVLSRERKGPICEERRCPFESTSSLSKMNEKSSIAGIRLGRRRQSKLLTPSLWTDNKSGSKSTSRDSHGSSLGASAAKQVFEKGDNNGIWVPFNGTGPCVQLNTENRELCEEDEKILFKVGDIVPKCGIPGRMVEARAIVRNACPPGSFYSIIGRCQPDWDF